MSNLEVHNRRIVDRIESKDGWGLETETIAICLRLLTTAQKSPFSIRLGDLDQSLSTQRLLVQMDHPTNDRAMLDFNYRSPTWREFVTCLCEKGILQPGDKENEFIKLTEGFAGEGFIELKSLILDAAQKFQEGIGCGIRRKKVDKKDT